MILTVASVLTTDCILQFDLINPVAFLLAAYFVVQYFHLRFLGMLVVTCILASVHHYISFFFIPFGLAIWND